MVIEGVTEYLRQEEKWSAKECGIQPRGIPPATTRSFYIAVDRGGTTNKDGESNYSLTEAYSFTIHIVRNAAWFPDDYRGKELLKTNPYVAGIATLDELERRVITRLHLGQYEIAAFINARFGLPSVEGGDRYNGKLVYTGSGQLTDYHAIDTSESVYMGWALSFRGLERVQSIPNMR